MPQRAGVGAGEGQQLYLGVISSYQRHVETSSYQQPIIPIKRKRDAMQLSF